MMKKIAAFAFGAMVVGAGFSAQAQEQWPRWYVGLSGSMTWNDDASVDGLGAGNNEITLDNGWGIGGSIGYMLPIQALNGLRVEGEIYHRSANVDSFVVNGVSVNGDDEITSTSYMVNALYDIKTGTRVTPYLGGGIGWAQVDVPQPSPFGNTGDSDNVFAWQLMAGLGYEPTTIPHVVFTAGYRYHATEDASLARGAGLTSIDVENTSHNLEVGAKFRF